MLRIFLLILVIISYSNVFAATQEPPEAGLRAEMNKEWQEAVSIYKDTLNKNPDRIDLWLRIAQIESALENYAEVIEALNNAIKIAPERTDLHHQLSAAYSMDNKPREALAEISKALELEPENLDYLKAKALLATWIGDYETAVESYKKLTEKLPDDDEVLLNLARANSWSNNLDDAVYNYRDYLAKHPDEKQILIEYSKTQTWRGNYAGALEILEEYNKKFGEDNDYLKAKADTLARSGKSDSALLIIKPLLIVEPDNYELNYANTYALLYGNRVADAQESLKVLERLRPNTKDTKDIKRLVITPIRTFVNFDAYYYQDSDDLEKTAFKLSGSKFLQPETSVDAFVVNHYLRAVEGSGLENIDGSRDLSVQEGRIGISHRFTPSTYITGNFGAAKAEGLDNILTYSINADFQPNDEIKLDLTHSYDYYLISPRAVSLDIKHRESLMLAQWSPTLRDIIVLEMKYDSLSDSNNLWELTFAPRRVVRRGQNFNLDIGVRGWWFGFTDTFRNGYYNPELYQSYQITSFGYWKISDDDGLGFMLSGGYLKDNEMTDFRFGVGLNVEASFGVYKDWMLKIRGAAINNERQYGGSFEAESIGCLLERRF